MKTTTLLSINIFGHQHDKQRLVSRLQELGVLHIAKATSKEQHLVQDTINEGLDDLSKQLLKLKYIAEQATLPSEYELRYLPKLEELQAEAQDFIDRYEPFIKTHTQAKQTAIEQADRLNARITVINNLPFKIAKPPRGATKRLYYGDAPTRIVGLNKQHCTLKKVPAETGSYYLFTIKNSYLETFKERLRTTPLKKIDISFLTEESDEQRTQLQAAQTAALKEAANEQQIIARKLSLEKLKLPYLITALENYRKQYTISNQFLASKNFFLIKGYAEEHDLQAIRDQLPEATIIAAPAGNDAPTKLKEGRLTKHFRVITELFGLPTYGQVDPTAIVAFFYPFFFGFMLSDIGYGLLLLLITIGLRIAIGKEFKTAYVVFGLSAISSMIFGLLFGSFFGNLIVIEPLLTDSFNASFDILIASLIIGLVHLNIGAGLKVYQERKKPLKEILIHETAFFQLQLAALFAIIKIYPLAIIFAATLVYSLYQQKGAFGLMDITGYFGTLFSYARLLALSLATAGVALAINIIAAKALAFGKIGMVLWLIIIIAGHLFNFVINLLGCSIHAARLHYVEFFGFFFEGEGKKFIPFKLKKTYGGTTTW